MSEYSEKCLSQLPNGQRHTQQRKAAKAHTGEGGTKEHFIIYTSQFYQLTNQLMVSVGHFHTEIRTVKVVVLHIFEYWN